jgi:hypothetical protein
MFSIPFAGATQSATRKSSSEERTRGRSTIMPAKLSSYATGEKGD